MSPDHKVDTVKHSKIKYTHQHKKHNETERLGAHPKEKDLDNSSKFNHMSLKVSHMTLLTLQT